MLERNAINQVFSCLGIVFAWMYSQIEGNRLSILLNVEAFDTSYVRYLINIQFSEDSICLELLSTVILICSKPFKISVVIFGPPAVDELLRWHSLHLCHAWLPLLQPRSQFFFASLTFVLLRLLFQLSLLYISYNVERKRSRNIRCDCDRGDISPQDKLDSYPVVEYNSDHTGKGKILECMLTARRPC